MRLVRNVCADASVSSPRVTGEYSFIKLGARRVRARGLRRRSTVASCDRSVVGSQVFFISLSHVPSSSVVDLARSSRLVLVRAYVPSFSLYPSLFSFCFHRSVNSTWASSLRMTHAARLTFRDFTFLPSRNGSVSRIFGLYSYFRVCLTFFPFHRFHLAENIITLTCLLAYVY